MKEDLASSWLCVPSAVSRMAQWPGAALPQAQLQLSPVSCRPVVGTQSRQGRDLLGITSQLCPVGKCTQAWHQQRQSPSTSALPCRHSTLRAAIGPLLCHRAVALNTFSLWFLFSCPPLTTHFTEISE